MTILIADDDRVMTHLLCTQMKKAGYQVMIAHDAMQAVMAAQRNPPDAVLLDVHMPAGGGLQTLRQLRASMKTSHIPVIVVSGSADAQMIEVLRQLGVEEFLSKPPDLDKLEHLLGKLIGRPVVTEATVSAAH